MESCYLCCFSLWPDRDIVSHLLWQLNRNLNFGFFQKINVYRSVAVSRANFQFESFTLKFHFAGRSKQSFFFLFRIFAPLENLSLTWNRQKAPILSYTRHSWQLSSEGSLACHTYCDTSHPFIMVISEDPPVAERLTVELSLCIVTTFVASGLRTTNVPHARRTLLNILNIYLHV